MNDFDSLKAGNYCLLSVITPSVLTPMKLSYTRYYLICYKGGLNREGGLNKFSSPERGAYWRGGLN